MGRPAVAYSAAETSSRRLKMISRGDCLMTRTYRATVESESIPILQMMSLTKARMCDDRLEASLSNDMKYLLTFSTCVLISVLKLVMDIPGLEACGAVASRV